MIPLSSSDVSRSNFSCGLCHFSLLFPELVLRQFKGACCFKERAYYYVYKDPTKQPLAQFASSKQEWSEDKATKKREKDGDPDLSYKPGWRTDDVDCLTSPQSTTIYLELSEESSKGIRFMLYISTYYQLKIFKDHWFWRLCATLYLRRKCFLSLLNVHFSIGTRAFRIAAYWVFGFPHNWEPCRNHVVSHSRCQELTPNKIHWPTPNKIHWPTLSHNIAENIFMTDSVALFWCHGTAAS